MARKRAHGSNQYRTRVGLDGVQASGHDLMVLVALDTECQTCGEVWGTGCHAVVYPPDFSHGNHGAYGNPLKAIRSPSCPPQVLESFARATVVDDGGGKLSWQMACKIARHPNCSSEALGWLLQHDRHQVRRIVAGHPQLSLQQAVTALEKERVWPRLVVNNPIIDQQACVSLAGHSSSHVRTVAACSEYCPSPILARLALDQSSHVRIAAAANPRTPHSALMELARDASARSSLLINTALDGEILREIYRGCTNDKTSYSTSWILRRVLAHPRCPQDVLLHAYQQYPDGEMMVGVASNPNCPPDLLQQLLRHPMAAVRAQVACNPSVQSEWLWQRARDSSVVVRETVATNRTCPSDVLVRMLQDRHPKIRAAVLGNPNLPEEYRALAHLAQ